MSDIVGVYKFMKSNIKNQGGGLSHPRVGPWQRVGSQISCIGYMSYQKKNQSSSSYTSDSAKKVINWLIYWKSDYILVLSWRDHFSTSYNLVIKIKKVY